VLDAEGVVEHLDGGARQFVVQEALEMILSSGLSVSWLTPITIHGVDLVLARDGQGSPCPPLRVDVLLAGLARAKDARGLDAEIVWFCLCRDLAGVPLGAESRCASRLTVIGVLVRGQRALDCRAPSPT